MKRGRQYRESLGQHLTGCPNVPSGIRYGLYTVDSVRALGMGMMSSGVSSSASF
jgi:hypothetical protein